MVKRTLAFALVALVAGSAYAAAPVRSMYTTALTREQALRPNLDVASPSAATLKQARAIVAAYEAVVRRYPVSSYSDNALWQAGRLELDVYARFGQSQDRDAGVRLLRRLAESYPTSKLAKLVSAQISRADAGASSAADRGSSREMARTAALPLELSRDASAAAATTVPTLHRAVETSKLATVRAIQRVVLPDTVRVTIDLDAEVPFADQRIGDPARVFVDLPSTRAAAALLDRTLRFDGDVDVVRQIRIGRHPNNTTRIVLDAAGVASYSIYPLYGPYRLVIDCLRAHPAASVLAARMLASRRLAIDWGHQLPAQSPRGRTLILDARADLITRRASTSTSTAVAVRQPIAPPPLDASAASTPTTAAIAAQPPVTIPAPPAASNIAGGFSMARQLGLGVSRIVIDPGHGGHDPGAQGKGIDEADLVLDVALRLEKLLAAVPGVEVILTRRTDEFVPLPERTAIANREGADLFLSIHANASRSAQARGVETYFLNFASNLSAASVAARENAASGQAMGALPDIVKAIALNNKLDESRDFALQVQRSMMEKLRDQDRTVRDLGVKQAPFVVLIGAAMPSVLAEISFLTNPQEAKLLKSNAYRQKIAEALYGAVRRYQTSLKAATAVAHQ
jgi:N-acetylmuramoyl-L-alanine amidase